MLQNSGHAWEGKKYSKRIRVRNNLQSQREQKREHQRELGREARRLATPWENQTTMTRRQNGMTRRRLEDGGTNDGWSRKENCCIFFKTNFFN